MSKANHSATMASPLIWKNETRTEIVTPGTGKTRSYGLDGKLLWEFGGMSSHTIPTPLAAHGLLLVTFVFCVLCLPKTGDHPCSAIIVELS